MRHLRGSHPEHEPEEPAPIAPLAPLEFDAIRTLLNRSAGLWFSDEMRAVMERRLKVRLAALHVDSFAAYRRRIVDDPVELGHAVEACAVNETYLFRDARQLATFRDHVLPRFANRSKLVIWSAGCAAGEEAYTLGAIVLMSGRSDRCQVLGTDISARCIAQARRGIVSASSVRADDFARYAHLFQKRKDGARVVSDALRQLCHFRQQNLLAPGGFGFVDVIFCRNVLIHMDEASRRKVLSRFYERLSPGGYLFLGHSESILSDAKPFEIEELPGDVVYRRASLDGRPEEGPESR